MDYRKLFYTLNTFNIALILLIPASVAFYSVMQVHFRAETEWVNASPPSLQFVGRLQQGMSRSEYESILQLIDSIEGVRSTQLEISIPEWRGDRSFQDQWNELWYEYASPLVFIQPDTDYLSDNQSSTLAESIRGVDGVIDIAASQGISASGFSVEQTERKQRNLALLYFILMVCICGALILNYPIRFRRQFAVLTGVEGVGSQLNPEHLWMRKTAAHVAAAIFLYTLLFGVSYLFFPLPLIDGGSPTFSILLLEGVFMTGALSAGVSLIGWWLPVQELEAVRVFRPTAFE